MGCRTAGRHAGPPLSGCRTTGILHFQHSWRAMPFQLQFGTGPDSEGQHLLTRTGFIPAGTTSRLKSRRSSGVKSSQIKSRTAGLILPAILIIELPAFSVNSPDLISSTINRNQEEAGRPATPERCRAIAS